MDIIEATRRFERWLPRFMPIVRLDLAEKHRRMRTGLFPFMRATYYRWCWLWNQAAADERRAIRVLAVGDLHVENFGTWRDSEGRLIWGINDFDEATRLPWTQDLVRLATSAHLATMGERIRLPRRTACDAILEGYRDSLEGGGRPFVLEEDHAWLRTIATSEMRQASAFWLRMDKLRTTPTVAPEARAAITRAMPEPRQAIRFARRVAGMGSLGRPRFVGIADWSGGRVAREAKAMAPSAWIWASGRPAPAAGYAKTYEAVISRAVRVPDPTVHVVGHWLLRRLGPHCTRIELADLPDAHDEVQLLYAMGFETANIHLGTKNARQLIRKELRQRGPRWLHVLAKTMVTALAHDWGRWLQS